MELTPMDKALVKVIADHSPFKFEQVLEAYKICNKSIDTLRQQVDFAIMCAVDVTSFVQEVMPEEDGTHSISYRTKSGIWKKKKMLLQKRRSNVEGTKRKPGHR